MIREDSANVGSSFVLSKGVLKMKYNRILIEYIRDWIILNERNLKFTSDNTFNPQDNEVLCTNITVSCESTVISHHSIIWSEVESLLDAAETIINSIKEALEIYSNTGMGIRNMYPKSMIMSPEEHRAYMQHVKTKMNSIYGAGNYCYGMSRANGKSMYQSELWKSFIESRCNSRKLPFIQDVIFNDPATIVFWKDGTKTVVKAQDGEEYDPEKGLAMAISKKAMGNNRNYYLTFKKYLKKYDEQYPELPQISFEEAMKRAGEVTKELAFGVSNKKRKKDNVK